jgi:glucose 1-dehydrogenase
MLCRNLALGMAPYLINVINVAPGAIATPMNGETLEDPVRQAALEREISPSWAGTAEEATGWSPSWLAVILRKSPAWPASLTLG